MTKRFGLILFAAVASIASAAQAAVFSYNVTLNGPSESPANASPGTGTGTVVYDDVAGTLALTAMYSGLTGTVTQTHFHAPTVNPGLGGNAAASAAMNAGIAIGAPSLPGFTLGATSGSYSNTLNLNDTAIYNATYLSNNGGTAAGARAAFVSALSTGRTYWNIHSSTFGGGEIRGFPTLVPEPAAALLVGVGLVGLNAIRRRRS